VDVGVLEEWISVAESGSYRLVDKQQVVLLHPCIVIPDDLVGLGSVGHYPERPELHEVAELARRTRTSVEPDKCWILLNIRQLGSLFTVEDER